MKFQLEMNFYHEDIMLYARDDNNELITYELPDGTVLPSSATVFDEVPVMATKLKKREAETLFELTNENTSRVNK